MLQPQRFQFIDRSLTPEVGFTLSEVILAILIVTIFVTVALQGMVVAMLLKSKSLQLSEANRWIQMDVESIRSQITASQLPFGTHQNLCRPQTADLGFADLIRDNLAGGNVTGTADYDLSPLVTTSITSKTFQIARKLSIPTTPENAGAKILGIEYTVSPSNGANLEQPILHFYTEVMPDAALQCQ
jgi:type II secretory pathway pseudopilin PulG